MAFFDVQPGQWVLRVHAIVSKERGSKLRLHGHDAKLLPSVISRYPRCPLSTQPAVGVHYGEVIWRIESRDRRIVAEREAFAGKSHRTGQWIKTSAITLRYSCSHRKSPRSYYWTGECRALLVEDFRLLHPAKQRTVDTIELASERRRVARNCLSGASAFGRSRPLGVSELE